jgi:hypothetical protein
MVESPIKKYKIPIWLVVSTPLKNIGQIGSSSQLLGKIKNVPNHQPAMILGWTPLKYHQQIRVSIPAQSRVPKPAPVETVPGYQR